MIFSIFLYISFSSYFMYFGALYWAFIFSCKIKSFDYYVMNLFTSNKYFCLKVYFIWCLSRDTHFLLLSIYIYHYFTSILLLTVWISCKQPIAISFCLFSSKFGPFTIIVITGKLIIISTVFSYFLFLLLFLCFLYSPFLRFLIEWVCYHQFFSSNFLEAIQVFWGSRV